MQRQRGRVRIHRNLAHIVLATLAIPLLATSSLAELRSQTPPAVFDLDKDRQTLVSLDGSWRFHPGDDPDGKLGWANPAYDDSSWPLLRSDIGWNEQGYRHYSGFAWYRFKVILPQNQSHLAIGIPRLLTSYQLFANGRLIGQFGSLPPHVKILLGYNQVFPLPDPIPSSIPGPSGQVITFAIRVWHSPYFATFLGGGPLQAPRFGELILMQSWKADQNNRIFWQLASVNILMLINLLAAVTGLALFAARPAEREYLWFGIYELLTGFQHLVDESPLFYPAGWHGYSFLAAVLAEGSWLFFLFFLTRILKRPRNWLFWAAIATVILQFLAMGSFQMAWINSGTWAMARSLTLIPYFACILTLLYQGTRRGVPDAKLLLVPVAICYTSWFTLNTYGILVLSGQTWIQPYFAWFFEITDWPFPISVQDVADLLMLLSIVAILPTRFARTRRDEQRFAGELEAARTVQLVLIPAEVPEVPGLEIRSVYKPAGHVGGDFFQVIPIASGPHAGSVLIVIGDVSGKGMPAAMTVSLLVGTVRTLAHYTQSPDEILRKMNQRMLARSSGGFTTCLVLRADPDGTLTAANAGHIAPYLEGKELSLENGFPLGLAPEATYPESIFRLSAQAQLTLMTDGVVEARNRAGELFGFDRTANIATQSAESIAEAAHSFGQDDDITVLTVIHTPSVPDAQSLQTS
jgi:stage II sporulation SpoE-like protein/7TM protein involved in diverse intracellular signaling